MLRCLAEQCASIFPLSVHERGFFDAGFINIWPPFPSILCYLLAYILQGTVLLENLIHFLLVKNLPEFYGSRRLITAFTIAHHLSLF